MKHGEEGGTTPTLPHGQSHIIKRPRLTTLLDESEARIVLLVAPAGYGKTTLAREWLEGTEGVAWYSGRPAMADVAALASSMAGTFGADDDSRAAAVERIEILAAKGQRPAFLARAVAAGIPSDCHVLVIDDCHHSSSSADSEAFLAELILHTALRVVITSRIRPSWIAPRMVVYGEVAAFGISELALTDEEARDVIGTGGRAEEFLHKARGWPAVIGLAAQRGSERLTGDVPADDLYAFFAEDLFQRAPAELQHALMLLALGGDATADVGRALFGAEYDDVVLEAQEHGFLSPAAGEQGIHPLLRRFLLAKLRDLPGGEAESNARHVVEILAERELWDECLAALQAFPETDLVSSTLKAALSDLLTSGRVATVKQWIALAHSNQISDPIVLLAEAETALRDRDDARAQALGARAGELLQKGDEAARAYTVAARAAHLRDDAAAVRKNVELAQRVGATVEARTAARWIEFASTAERSPAEATRILDLLRNHPDDRPDHAIRLIIAQHLMAVQTEGDVRAAAEECDVARALVPHVRDPFLTTNVLNMAANLAVMLARYERALTVTDELVAEARASGLEFAVDHALITRASALIGLRRLSAAKKTLNDLNERADLASAFVAGNTQLQEVRLRIAAGDLERAASLLQREPPDSSPAAFRGELFAYRGMISAALGERLQAERAFQETRTFSEYRVTTLLCDLGRAILELQDGDRAAPELSAATLLRAVEHGQLDTIVTAARAFPELVRSGSKNEACARAVTHVLLASCDFDLGRRAGLEMPRELRRSERLSPRERDVYELVVQGRTNKQIARTLFISESTTKVHVRHIFEKLGVHSRAEAARTRLPDDFD